MMMDRKIFIQRSGSLLFLASLSRFKLSGRYTNHKNNTIKKLKTICTTCGTQFRPDESPPEFCPICADDRQYINGNGQSYTDPTELNKKYGVKISQVNKRLYEIKMIPDFAIGQRCFLVITDDGNILWDCIPLLNEAVIAFIRSKGTLKAIAFSHPHYYSTMNDWAATFHCPVFIHQEDEKWIMYKSSDVELWSGHEKPLWSGMRIINLGGHFSGSSVLYLPSQTGKGTLLCGDTFYISRSKRHVAVMYSYPNQILLTKTEFVSVYNRSADLDFDTMYGAFEGQDLKGNGKEIFASSMKRYLTSYGI